MKRSPALVELSREHHTALVLAKRAQAFGGERSAASDAFAAKLLDTFRHELAPHFRAEEAGLLPALLNAGETALVERTLAEHVELQALATRIAEHEVAALADFGKALAAHVRFEERQLFPAAEEKLAPDLLAAMPSTLPPPAA